MLHIFNTKIISSYHRPQIKSRSTCLVKVKLEKKDDAEGVSSTSVTEDDPHLDSGAMLINGTLSINSCLQVRILCSSTSAIFSYKK